MYSIKKSNSTVGRLLLLILNLLLQQAAAVKPEQDAPYINLIIMILTYFILILNRQNTKILTLSQILTKKMSNKLRIRTLSVSGKPKSFTVSVRLSKNLTKTRLCS